MMMTLLAIIGLVLFANVVVLAALGAQYRREVAARQPREARVLTPPR
ncbi:hypothetical protein [Aeromicrobium sp. Root495]|nr:hypothetical protein [Aeromicrobium sp. Root495]